MGSEMCIRDSDTEARQIWSKDTVTYEKTVPFVPFRSDTSSTAEPSTSVNSSNISLTTTDSSQSTIVLSPSVVELCTAARAATTATTTVSSSAATRTSSVVPSGTVRLPARESSGPCNYCSVAPTTSSSTTTDLDDSACATATVSPASDSVQLDPLAPPFVPTSVIASPSVFANDSVVNSNYCDECELSDDCLLYTSPSPRDRTRSRMPSSA